MKKKLLEYLELCVTTIGVSASAGTIAGMGLTSGLTIALFISSPFLPDEYEQKFSGWILEAAGLTGISLAIAGAAKAVHNRLPRESIKVSMLEFSEPVKPDRQLCAFCQYCNPEGDSYLLCAVQPSGSSADGCPDFDPIQYR